MYARSVVVFDSEGGELAEAALQLVSTRCNVMYVNHFAELTLMSREHAERLGAVLAPVSVLLEELPTLLKRVVHPLDLAASAVLPVGDRPDEATLESLRVQGLRWALWKPFQPADLHFAATLALQTHDPGDARREVRVPCARPVVLQTGGRERAAVLRDLSATGAYLHFADTLAAGSALELRLRLGDVEHRLPGRVAWSSPGAEKQHGDEGVGIQFDPLDPSALEALRDFVSRKIDSYRL